MLEQNVSHPLILSDDLMLRCRKALLRSNKFATTRALETVFIRQGLEPYRYKIPQVEERTERVDQTMKLLLDKGIPQGTQAVFLRFLKVLQELENEEDDLYRELGDCSAEVEQEIAISNVQYASLGLSSEQWENILEIARHIYRSPAMQDSAQKSAAILSKYFLITSQAHDSTLQFFPQIVTIVSTNFSSASATFPNNIERLAEILYDYEGDSPQWLALDALLCKLFGRVVSPTRLQQLQDILERELAQEPRLAHRLKSAYIESLPKRWHHPVLQDGSITPLLELILKDLAKIPYQKDKTYPIFEFAFSLVRLAELTRKDSLTNTLKAWIDVSATSYGLDSTQRFSIYQRVLNRVQDSTAYLVITLEEVAPQVFNLSICLLNNEYALHPAKIQQRYYKISTDEIPTLIAKLHNQCEAHIEDPQKNLVIEFFLPYHLLSMNVYDWLVKVNGEIPSHLALAHNVVVRSYNRVRNRQMYSIWRRRWQMFQAVLEGSYAKTANKKFISLQNKIQCSENMHFFLALQDSSIVCLAFNFDPFANADETQQMVINAINAGIPVALWLRKKEYTPIDQKWLKSQLSRKKLSKYPNLIYEERRKLFNHDKLAIPGGFVTLLWDNADHLPPEIPRRQYGMARSARR